MQILWEVKSHGNGNFDFQLFDIPAVRVDSTVALGKMKNHSNLIIVFPPKIFIGGFCWEQLLKPKPLSSQLNRVWEN
jgi:hypothetical protein